MRYVSNCIQISLHQMELDCLLKQIRQIPKSNNNKI